MQTVDDASSTILLVFSMVWPWIEPRFLERLENILPTRNGTVYIYFLTFNELTLENKD